MRIGVTGASGFIGSHLTRALKKHGKVVTLSRGKSLPSLAHLKSFVSGVDLFFHLGGVNRGTNENILTGNVTGTLRLLEAIKRYGELSARILFASSAQVYRLKNRAEKISEKSALQPESVYGVSKKSAEDLIRISGLPYTILRITNAYGPGCRADYNSVVTTFCHRTENKIPLEINGQGKQNRDFIYIDDIVRAFLIAGFQNQTPASRAYNVSSGRMTSLVKIVNTIRKFEPYLEVKFKPGADDGISYCCDASRYKRDFGWSPKTPLTKGIQQTLNYFRRRKNK
jgi:UDP-glucose 4-epimerase